ncbi:hypothetical protein EBI01_18980 [Marinomonas rhizomae]|uniref:asparagine synthase (glutamine-hydrolyzing) n=1 Tax=Marinomonas rhizomae TaxID=491948 RepID=A0A366JAG5_9GAMM|nr:asparagine synthase-related protein [Marinomonas rhizomae]RBP83274.1 asparagine synthase [Marinomonas rhizomae]RNF69388.1 hypothetical protein EBI01_18980 [Marinomonas rhizomae]
MIEFDFIYSNGEVLIKLDGVDKKVKVGEVVEIINTPFKDRKVKELIDERLQFQSLFFSENTLEVCTDIFSTYDTFIYHSADSDFLMVSTSLFRITKYLYAINKKISIDMDGVKSMISIGYMMSDLTYVKDIKRLPAASKLFLDLRNYEIKKEVYHFFSWNPSSNNVPISTAISDVDDILIDEIKKLEVLSGEQVYSYLSGGLDSRVTTYMLNDVCEQKNLNTITFSNSYSSDEIIARRISKDIRSCHIQIPLTDGNFISQLLEEVVYKNSGMVNLMGAIAQRYAISKINIKSSVIFSGQIGDLTFGSYANNSSAFSLKNHFYFDDFCDTSSYETINKLYNSDFEYGINEKTPRAVTNGDKLVRDSAKVLSPFYNAELNHYTMGLPHKYMNNSFLYREWMKKRHPEMVKFKWEKTGFKPSGNLRTKYGSLYKKYKNGVMHRLSLPHDDMNPFQYWFSSNEKLSIFIKKSFEYEIQKIDDEYLKRRLTLLFNSRTKHWMLAYTIAKSINLIFGR